MFSGISNLFGGKKKAKNANESEDDSDSESDQLRNMSAEEVDSDDMAGGLCYSDEEPDRRGIFKAARSAKRGGGGVRRGGGNPEPKKRRKKVV